MKSEMVIKVQKKREGAIIPQRATAGAAGMDLYACIDEDITIKAGESALVATGIAIELPSKEMAAFVFARSGLATKFGIALANSVGVVDSDYRGEIYVSLRNFSAKDYTVKQNERIAQMIIMPVLPVSFCEVESLEGTVRGEGGFGSTGK